jgi:cell wall-associated NlpC family hydrolase
MKKLILNIALPLSVFIFVWGCQPNIRYSTNTHSTKESSKQSKSSSDLSKDKCNRDKLSIELIIKELTGVRRLIVAEAENWYGVPYCTGGEDKRCSDCSGFTSSVFEHAGISLPRTAEQQYDYAMSVEESKAEAGDLVFFRTKGKITHVGIYLGNRQFIHASSSRGVILESLDVDYFKNSIAGFGRVIDE